MSLLVVMVWASSQNLSSAEDVSLLLASWGGAGVDSDPETLKLELIFEAILGDEFCWFKHPVDVQLVLVSLCTTRDACPGHDVGRKEFLEWSGMEMELTV